MRRLRLAAFLLMVAPAGLTSPLADPEITGTSGPEFQVSEFFAPRYSYGYRFGPAADLADTGDFLVVWATWRPGGLGGMAARAFDSNGAPRGSEIDLGYGAIFRYFPDSPDVAAGGGQFVAAWTSYDGNYGSGYKVLAQRFNLQGGLEGPGLEVSYLGYYPQVEAQSSGEFIVAWDFSRYARVRRFDETGAPSWPWRHVGDGFHGRADPDVAVDASGDITVVWSRLDLGGPDGIFGRRFDSAGIEVDPQFPISQYAFGSQREPAIAPRPDGGFVAVWTSNQDGSLSGVFGRIFDGDLQPMGAEFQINTTTAGYQEEPDVGADARGNFVVVWHTRTNSQRGDTVLGQRFDAAGTRVGGEFQVNEAYTTGQHLADVGMRDDGEFLLSWFSMQPSGATSVRARLFCATPNVGTPQIPPVCAGNQATLTVAATGRQPFSYQWRRDGVTLPEGGRFTGTTSPSLAIADVDASDAGSYDAVVADACPVSQALVSGSGQLSVQPPLPPVEDLTLEIQNAGATLRFTWAPAAGAADYVVRRAADPSAAFASILGTGSDPAAGLTVPLSPETEFFLVAARNPICGEGPLR